MRNITSEELSVIVEELQAFTGFYIEQFYETGEDRFRMKLTKSGVTANLQIILLHTINKTEYIEKQGMPTSFAAGVRKRIDGFQVSRIVQLNNDRIVMFELKKGSAVLNLIFEMFGNGNLIIADKDMKILLAQKQQTWKGRVIKSGLEYVPPEQPPGYKFEKPAYVTPILYRDGKRAVDYSIRELEKYRGMVAEGYESLQEVLDKYYFENWEDKDKDKDTGQKKAVAELEKSIKKQEGLLQSIDVNIEANKNAGKTLLENMGRMNMIINAARKNRRITREELQRQFPDVKILNVDLKNKKIRIELG